MANQNNGIMVLRKVTTVSEYKQALKRIDELMDIAEDDPRIYELMYLSYIVADYEDAVYPIPETTPADIIGFMMTQKNIKQKDLISILGSEGMVSMVLNGKRALTVEKMVKLGKFLGVPIALLAENRSKDGTRLQDEVSGMVADPEGGIGSDGHENN